MRKIYFLLLLITIGGCSKAQEDHISTMQIKQKTIDSLQIVLHQKSIEIDSLSAKLKQQRTLIKFTALKCHKYAAIVKKSPSQSVFIVNWIDRAFLWIDEK